MDLDMFDFLHNAQVGNNVVDVEVGDDVPAKATPDIPVDVVDVEDDGGRLNPRKRKPHQCRNLKGQKLNAGITSTRFVEGIGFKRFCRVLQPQFDNIPTRTTVARDIDAIYINERGKLKKLLKGCRVCLTTDTWTSIQNLNYMCLTAHFIDDNWKL
ncbi:hypothetical protein RHMOL_Rhmol10G0050800 [Rhododendron molle]|uniref:Uncharacterized protein n=1 Tax=Rhododendron molle TaxID=49168 RepID=A0ACC0M0S7_RHOML|nr:hypothetical protein RHMOL_Rhmol10G0050800 [Rhododendron molle]